MSKEINGFIAWITSFLDDIYAPKGSGGGITLDDVYPIGSIYMSVNSTSPQSLFGGNWTQLTDTFLYASNTADTNSTTSTNGEATHTLTTDEMPSHTHTQNAHSHGTGNSTNKYFLTSSVNTIGITANKKQSTDGSSGYNVWSSSTGNIAEYTATQSVTATNQNKGGGQAHNNMPPYMRVFMWKRTA